MLEIKKAMNTLHDKAVERDVSVDRQLDRVVDRLNRHRSNADAHQTVIREYGDRITQLEKDNEVLLGRVSLAESNICTCWGLHSTSGNGSQERPFELEYEDSEYVTPPVTSAASSPPSENTVPVPVMVLRWVLTVLS